MVQPGPVEKKWTWWWGQRGCTPQHVCSSLLIYSIHFNNSLNPLFFPKALTKMDAFIYMCTEVSYIIFYNIKSISLHRYVYLQLRFISLLLYAVTQLNVVTVCVRLEFISCCLLPQSIGCGVLSKIRSLHKSLCHWPTNSLHGHTASLLV